MHFLRKLSAIVVMILAVIGALLCLGGVIGAWAVNTPATEVATGALTAADTMISRAEQLAIEANARIQNGVGRLNEVDQALADAAEGKAPRIDEINQKLANVSELLLGVGQTASAVESGMAGAQQTLGVLSMRPAARLPAPTGQFEAAAATLGQLGAKAKEVGTALAQVEVEPGRVRERVQEATTQLSVLSAQLASFGGELAQVKAATAEAKSATPGLIDLGSIGATLFLLLFGAGQISLFIHALAWFKDDEPAGLKA